MIPQHTWVSKLFGYDFRAEYNLGRLNATADPLSCHDEDMIQLATCTLSQPDLDLFNDFRAEVASLPDLLAKRSEVEQGLVGANWTVADAFVLHRGHIFVPKSSTLWPHILAMAHSVGHEGVQKTLYQLRASFCSPHAIHHVRDYVRGCGVCQRNKTEHLHLVGPL